MGTWCRHYKRYLSINTNCTSSADREYYSTVIGNKNRYFRVETVYSMTPKKVCTIEVRLCYTFEYIQLFTRLSVPCVEMPFTITQYKTVQ